MNTKDQCNSSKIGSTIKGLTIIGAFYKPTKTGKYVMYTVRCNRCGKVSDKIGSSVLKGVSPCDCSRQNLIGVGRTRLYTIYTDMKERCYNKNSPTYKRYGGRGIAMCDEWLGRDGYTKFKEWALRNGYADNLSIDRIDNDKGYSPDNCRWTTPKEQANNTRNNHFLEHDGERHTISQWAEITGINRKVISSRVTKLGWSDEKALTTPVRHLERRGM